MTDRALDFDLGAYGRDITLRRGIASTDTALDITEGAGRTLPAVPFPVTIIAAADPDDTEKAWVTARTGDTLTVTRGYDSTIAKDRLAGDFVAVDANLEAVYGDVSMRVAASNATDAEKAAAHFVCDGTDDEVEINAAIEAIAAVAFDEVYPTYFRGVYILELSRGTFNLGDSIVIPDAGESDHYSVNVLLRGVGKWQTNLELDGVPTGDGMIDVQNVNGYVHLTIDQLHLYMHDTDGGYGTTTKPVVKMQTQTGLGYVRLYDVVMEHW